MRIEVILAIYFFIYIYFISSNGMKTWPSVVCTT